MTAPELPPITCPSSLVASCAPLLGFEPRDCLVGVVHAVPGRAGPVLIRLDIGSADEAPRRAQDLLAGIQGTGGAAVALVAFVAAGDDERTADLDSAPVMGHLLAAAWAEGLSVVAAISTNGRVWWTHDCADPGCCPGARPLDQSVLTGVRAEYAYAGFAPMASRDAVVERVAVDERGRARTARALLGLRPPTRLERWRDAQLASLDRLLVPRPVPPGDANPGRAVAVRLTPARAARALRALEDIPVRDSLLVRLLGGLEADDAEWRRCIDTLCQLVRLAPSGRVAAAATVTATVAWVRGDGALANAALDRAEDDCPSYRLAGLVRRVMASGVDPRVWVSAMAGLTEQECRDAGRGSGA